MSEDLLRTIGQIAGQDPSQPLAVAGQDAFWKTIWMVGPEKIFGWLKVQNCGTSCKEKYSLLIHIIVIYLWVKKGAGYRHGTARGNHRKNSDHTCSRR